VPQGCSAVGWRHVSHIVASSRRRLTMGFARPFPCFPAKDLLEKLARRKRCVLGSVGQASQMREGSPRDRAS